MPASWMFSQLIVPGRRGQPEEEEAEQRSFLQNLHVGFLLWHHSSQSPTHTRGLKPISQIPPLAEREAEGMGTAWGSRS